MIKRNMLYDWQSIKKIDTFYILILKNIIFYIQFVF